MLCDVSARKLLKQAVKYYKPAIDGGRLRLLLAARHVTEREAASAKEMLKKELHGSNNKLYIL